MRMKWRDARFSLALALGCLALAGTPAHAGDDEDCYSTTIGGWDVWYDNLCTKEILKAFPADEASIGISLIFPTDSSQGPSAIGLFNPVEYAGILQPASGAEIFVNGRSIEKSGITYGGGVFSAATARAVFDALRQQRNVTIAVSFNSGPKIFAIDPTGFDAAYQQLLQ